MEATISLRDSIIELFPEGIKQNEREGGTMAPRIFISIELPGSLPQGQRH